MIDFEKAIEILNGSDNFELFCHIHPDGDTVGSAFALAAALISVGKKAKVTCLDTFPKTLSYIWNVEKEDFEANTAVTIDVASLELLGDDFDTGRDIELAIDHHENNRVNAKNTLCYPDRAATGEIILELIEKMGIPLTKYIAECLYTAIATDTGRFNHSNTTERTYNSVAKLVRYTDEGNFHYLNVPLFISKAKKQLAFESEIISNLQYYHGDRICVSTIDKAILKKYGINENDTGGIENISKIPEGVKVGVTLKERDGGYKVSLRSDDDIDSAKICAIFGGGGHKCASGCFIEGTRENALDKILSAIENGANL